MGDSRREIKILFCSITEYHPALDYKNSSNPTEDSEGD